KPLEEVLLIRPSSNIAYLVLKDAFPSQSALEAYLNHLARRAAAPGAPENLRLLHLRFLMEGGEWQTARKLARAWNWSREMSRELLFRAGLLDRPAAAPGIRPENKGRSVEAAARSPDKAEEPSPDASETGMSSAGSRTGAGDSLDPQRGRPHEAEAETEVPPDFGPADPRSAPFHLSRSEAALVRKDEPTAMKEMRQALEAAPLLQQPRILLALMLEEANRPQEARQALRGAVEVSPWDLYMQAWRTVRDEYIDPDHDGVDLYALRRRARESIQTVADAKRQIHFLLDVLNDRYARLFPAGEFARYLLAPNAGRKALLLADDVAAGETWLPIPDHPESDRAAGLASLPPEDGGATLPAPSGRPAGGGIPAPAPGSFTEEDHGDVSGTGETGDSRRTGGAAPDSHEMVKRAAKDAGSSGNLAGGSMEQTSGREAHFMVRPAMRDPVMQAAKLTLRMGYIRIPTLNGLDVPARLDQALASLHGVEGAILDLRGNGGGDGGIAAEVASRFLPPGTTVCTYLTRRGLATCGAPFFRAAGGCGG
ncbi:MAG: S41 family peptidase, partial [Acidobacteriota bacterium]